MSIDVIGVLLAIHLCVIIEPNRRWCNDASN